MIIGACRGAAIGVPLHAWLCARSPTATQRLGSSDPTRIMVPVVPLLLMCRTRFFERGRFMVDISKLGHRAVERDASPNKIAKAVGSPQPPDWYGKAEISISVANRPSAKPKSQKIENVWVIRKIRGFKAQTHNHRVYFTTSDGNAEPSNRFEHTSKLRLFQPQRLLPFLKLRAS